MISITDVTAKGRYMKTRLSLCHKPSLSTKVPLNSGLSAITNNTKNTIARTKLAILTDPIKVLCSLNDNMAKRSGKNRKTKNL